MSDTSNTQMMRRTLVRRLALLACFLAACNKAADAGGTPPLGTRENSWTIDSVPVLDIPGTGPNSELIFAYAAAGTRLSSGLIAIADPRTPSVRFFDSQGLLVREVGREGTGPGEFNSPWWIGQCATDSVFVWDRMLSRMTVLNESGKLVREFRLTANPVTLSCSRQGRLAALLTPRIISAPAPDGRSPDLSAPLWLFNTRGDSTASLGTVVAGETRPLGRLTRIAIGGDHVYVGTADSGSVDVYGLDGKRLTTLSLGTSLRRPSQRDYERAIDDLAATMSVAAERARAKTMLLEYPMPEYLPAYRDLFVDPAGTVFAVTSSPGDSTTRLRTTTANGESAGEIVIPVPLKVFEVGEDYVLGVLQDADSGEQRVRLYRMRRTT